MKAFANVDARRGVLRNGAIKSDIESFQTAAGKSYEGLARSRRGLFYLILINTDVEPEMISSMRTDHSPAVDSRNKAELPGSLF